MVATSKAVAKNEKKRKKRKQMENIRNRSHQEFIPLLSFLTRASLRLGHIFPSTTTDSQLKSSKLYRHLYTELSQARCAQEVIHEKAVKSCVSSYLGFDISNLTISPSNTRSAHLPTRFENIPSQCSIASNKSISA